MITKQAMGGMKWYQAVFFSLLWSFGQSVWAIDTHCTNDETIIFNCSVGKKIVSVCSAKQVAADAAYIQYRFGRKGLPEKHIPANKDRQNAVIHANTLTFAGGGGAYMRFGSGQYAYVVYAAIGRGWGEKAGVVVEKGFHTQAVLHCKHPVISELGPDFFKQAQLPEDQQGFELP